MSQYLGDKALNDTIYFGFNTHKADGTPITLAGTPAISIYDNDTTTESTTGVTLTTDFDSRTGYHVVKVVCTDAFYASGHQFKAVITAGTVDSISVVGVEVAHWTIEKNAALRPTVAGRTLDVASTGEAGLDFTNRLDTTGILPSAQAGAASGLAIVGSAMAVADKTGFSLLTVPPTASEIRTEIDANSKLANVIYGLAALKSILDTIAGYIDTEVSAIKAKTDNLPALPAATGDIPSSATIASQVRTELTTELARIDAAISSRLAASGYMAPDNAGIAALPTLAEMEASEVIAKVSDLPSEPPTASDIDAVLTETHGSGSWGLGDVVTKTYTLTDASGIPVAGIVCWVTSDEAGLYQLDIARETNASGQATFNLFAHVGDTVYVWHRGSLVGDPEVI